MVDNFAQERVLLITTCFEKPVREKDRLCVLIVTQFRIILIPFRDTVPPQEHRVPVPGEKRQTPEPSRGRWLKTHPVQTNESSDALVKKYCNREPEEILRSEKDAREIRLDKVIDIDIRRVRNDLKYSRWLSVFFPPYSFGPANARYVVDYLLTIVTSAGSDILLTPFLLELKQILVDQLGEKVHETVDSTAPLL